jgi:LmbE family N-acetylglucosaminyl deacetylase
MTEALCVVAHHDDAIIWMGGAIQRMRGHGWKWTIAAMCVPDQNRRRYYEECCQALDSKTLSMSFADYQGGQVFERNSQERMSLDLKNGLGGKRFDWVFTHSRHHSSEYGFHANHIEVATVVAELVQNGQLGNGTSRLAHFSYAPIYGGDGRATVARPGSSYYLQLTYGELLTKCEWCSRAPDADTNLYNIGFPCPNPEAFEVDGGQLPRPFIPK